MAVLPVVAVLATADGLPGSRLDLSGAAAWLASPKQGLVTLLDGPSAQVVSSVALPPGDDMTVVQGGSSAYVVSPGRGTVSHVDGATYEVSKPVQFGPGGAGAELAVYPGRTGTYIVDSRRRQVSLVDPVSLAVRQRMSLTTPPAPGQSVVDGQGRLWAVEGTSLVWFDGAGKHVRPQAAGPESRLVLVGDHAVLVDMANGRVGELADTGAVRSWSCLDLRASDRVQLLGSATLGRVVAAIPETGMLVVSGKGLEQCGVTVPIGEPGLELGPLAEASGFVFVPDRSTGQAKVLDVTGRRIVAEPRVVRPGARFELLAAAGRFVFYNDRDSNTAGVFEFNGARWQRKAVRKYDPNRPGAGVVNSRSGDRDGQRPGEPDRPDPDQPDGQRQPDDADPNTPDPDPDGDPESPDTGQQPDPGSGGPDPGQDGPPPPGPPVISGLNVDPDVVVREQSATFSAEVSNAAGASWRWTVVDPATGAQVASSTSVGSFDHTFPPDTPDALELRLQLEKPGAAPAERLLPFRTTASRQPQIESITADPAVPIPGQQVTFTGVENAAGADGRWRWTVTTADGTPVAEDPLGPPRQFQHTFTDVGQFQVTLEVTFDGTTVSADRDLAVDDQCTLSPRAPNVVDLSSSTTAEAAADFDNCFGRLGRIQVSTASFLSAACCTFQGVGGGGGGAQNGAALADITQVSEPPGSGSTIADAVTFSIANRPDLPTVSYAVRVNRLPVIVSFSCRAELVGSEPAAVFTVTATDDSALEEVLIQIGPSPFPLVRQTPSGQMPAVFENGAPHAAIRRGIEFYTVQVRDFISGRVVTATGPRGDCWPP